MINVIKKKLVNIQEFDVKNADFVKILRINKSQNEKANFAMFITPRKLYFQ